MPEYFYRYLVLPLVGWLAAVSLLFVGYLVWLEINERRRNRELDQQREQLGL
jgi:cytochrome c-type biogenesis protein CcmH/NrfF